MRSFVFKLIFFVAIAAGCVGLKSIQFRLEGISAGQSHLLSERGSSGGPSRLGGSGIRRVLDQDKRDG